MFHLVLQSKILGFDVGFFLSAGGYIQREDAGATVIYTNTDTRPPTRIHTRIYGHWVPFFN
jgi:hypothetical protein